VSTTISSLIEFLLALLGDEELQAEFQEDPEGVLGRYGLDTACGVDIRDAQPMIADQVGVEATNGGPTFTDGEDPVPEITVLTNNYVVHRGPENNEYNYYFVDDSDIIITVDDRDTVTIEAEGDVTIENSFNQDNDITVIEDSFNQDNDGVDNKGGTIDDSVVGGDDLEDSLNSDDDTSVSGSENTTVTETNTDASEDVTVDGSFTGNISDNDLIDADVAVDSGSESDLPAPTAVHEPEGTWPSEDADVVELDGAESVAG
jgi:hypothetical protein